MEPDRAFLQLVGQAALCNPPTLVNTWDLTVDLLRRGVPGDLVECGVFAGVQPAAMARVCQLFGDSSRRVHLFDSFAGIPQAGPHDDRTITDCIGVPASESVGALVSTGVSACSVESVQRNMANWGVDAGRLVYHPGWFQHTVPTAGIGPIALLRLDGDLYESTKVCLEHLYPKLSLGGYCVIDDYALTGCRLAVTEYLASIGESPEIITIEGGGGPVYWRRP